MGDRYDLLTVIKKMPSISSQLRWEGRYNEADILEVAEEKLRDYLQVIRAKGQDQNSEQEKS